MKRMRITVNGKSYDVEVEVLEDDGTAPAVASLSGPPAAPRPVPPAAVAAPVPFPRAGAGPVDPDVIAAPIAGTVQRVFVAQGEMVEAKTPVVLLDAMKMDTYIYAPRSGRVREVLVTPGATVQVRDPLLRYEPEA